MRAALALALALASPAAAQVRVLIGGDVSFGENYQAGYKAAGGVDVLEAKGYDWSVAKLAPLLDRADYTIVNLETPITALKTSPLKGKDYYHWSHIDRAPDRLAAYGVDAVGLANNHTLDFGPVALRQTFDALRRHGIAWFGAGENLREAAQPLVRTFRDNGREATIAVIAGFAVRKEYQAWDFYAGEAAIGENPLDPAAVAKQVADLRQRFPGIFVIAYPHWGSNYAWASKDQVAIGHALIDAGVDMAVGHHAHMMGEVERYRGKWIVYSLGNFLFNALGRFAKYPDAVPFGLAMELNLNGRRDGMAATARLYPIFTDNSITNYQTRMATPAEADRAFAKLMEKSALGADSRLVRRGGDTIGRYFELPLDIAGR